MSEIQEIANWLNGNRDFDSGFALYIAYINEPTERQRLQRMREPDRLYKHLRERFYQLKAVKAANHIIQQAVSVAASVTPNIISVKPATNSVTEEQLKQAWSQYKTEQEAWHAELRVFSDMPLITPEQQKQTAKLCQLIIANEEVLHELGNAYNHFKLYGKVPAEFVLPAKKVAPAKKKKAIQVTQTDADKLLYLKNRLNPNISKLKGKIADAQLIENPTPKQRKKLAEWDEKLIQLEAEKQILLHGQPQQ